MHEMAKQMTKLLAGKAAMLFEYFSLQITEQGELMSLPLLLGIFLFVIIYAIQIILKQLYLFNNNIYLII